MDKLLEQIMIHLDDLERGNGFFVRFECIQQGCKDSVRADLLSLHVIKWLPGPGLYRYWRMFGAVAKKRDYPIFRFSPGNVRISKGYRKSAVLHPAAVKGNEQYAQAGVTKDMVIGEGRHKFDPDSKRDFEMLETALAGFTDGRVPVRHMEYPDLYLTFKASDTESVRFGAPLAHLIDRAGYDDALSVDDNLQILKATYARPLGPRIGYPYKFFDGKGVLAFEWRDQENINRLGTWAYVPDLQQNDEVEVAL